MQLGITDDQLNSFIERLRKPMHGMEAIDSVAMLSERAIVFDNAVSSFIRTNPDCTIINLGAGLCTRYYRVGADTDSRITWIEIDMPEVIKMREGIEQKKPNHVLVSSSATDDFIPKIKHFIKSKVLFIAEGLALYLTEEEVKKMFRAITTHLKDSRMLIEVDRSSYLNSVKSAAATNFNLTLLWGLDNYRDIERMNSGIRLVEEIPVQNFQQVMVILHISL